jgi:hypothetical protein
MMAVVYLPGLRLQVKLTSSRRLIRSHPELALRTFVPAESDTNASTCILGLSLSVTLKWMTAR